VLLEQDGARLRIGLEQLRDPARHGEAGALVVEPDDLVAERLLGEPPPVGRGRERDHSIGMRVVDVVGMDERVQQRLDRRARLVRRKRRAKQVVDHRSVVHLLAVAQRQHVVEPDRREPAGGDRRQVRAGSLHPEHARLAARVVGDRSLRRRVAAALVRECAVGAEQVRAVDESFE